MTDIEQLVGLAQDTVNNYGDNQNYTVAAAVMTNSGKIYVGLNLFHFTGGPCGEIAALTAAISDGGKNLKTIVAVGNNNRGVIAPCGRCRQVLFDYYPQINVVINHGNDLVLIPIKDMLPEIYDWNKEQETV